MDLLKPLSDNKKRFILIFVVAQTIGLAVSAMVALFGAVEKQSIEHQKALSPIFEFVIEEFVKPLNFAVGIARGSRLHDLLVSGRFEEAQIIAELNRLREQTGFDFFVASEIEQKQYSVDGAIFDLSKDQVIWYEQAKANDKEAFGMIGNSQNPHLYFDVKVFAESGTFVGFIGVGIPFSKFITKFDSDRSVYGYEMVIINDAENIIYATDESLRATGDQISKLSDVYWYQALSEKQQQLPSLNNEIITVAGNKLLLAETSLKQIGWKFYLLNPLHLRKGNLLNSFLLQTAFIFFVVCLLIVLTKVISDVFASGPKNKVVLDPLTGVPNRDYLESKFYEFSQQNVSLCLLVLDLDHFKSVNDNFGHAGGDAVLCETVSVIKSELRDSDTIVRWGGEEFVILLANCPEHIGKRLAERIRAGIEKNRVTSENSEIKVTASIGVAFSKQSNDLSSLFKDADEKLYKAKKAGRNQVVMR